jgi:glycosyltransferase involved in cell wall biosynthesis
MRIGFFTDGYIPSIDGLVTSMLSFKKEFHKLGHSVLTVAPSYPNYVDKEEDIIRIPSISAPFPPGYRIAYTGLSKILPKLDKLDIIHAQSPFSVGWLAYRVSKKLKLPLVMTYHTLYPEYITCYIPRFKKILRYFTTLQNRFYCNKCDLVISPSPQMKEKLISYGVKTRIEVLPTGLDLDLLQGGNGDEFRKKYNIPSFKKILLFMGRLGREKNVKFLIDCIPEIIKVLPNILLIISGEGVALDELKAQVNELKINDYVMFLGFLDKTDWVNCYNAADLFVFSSLTETQGLVLLEAMATGTPVVAVGALGVLDVLKGEKGGLLSSLDKKEFSQKVIIMLTDKELYERKKKEALERAQEISSTTMAKKLISLYENVIQKFK